MAKRLEISTGPTHVFLPLGGVEEWNRGGGEAHDREGMAALIDEARKFIPSVVPMTEVDAHINDVAFSNAVLARFDDWLAAEKRSAS